jgi:hypothetical protein
MSFRGSEMLSTVRSSVGDPDYLLGLVGLVLSVLFVPVGLPVSVHARHRSQALGLRNEPAEWGVAISTVMLGLLAGALVLSVVFALAPLLIL